MPKFDAPKVQPPSWMKSSPPSASAPTIPSWGAAPPPRPARGAESANDSGQSSVAELNSDHRSLQDQGQTSTDSAPAGQPAGIDHPSGQASANSDFFGTVDATRQALAQTQLSQRPNPLMKAMSSLRAYQKTRRDDAPPPMIPPYQAVKGDRSPQPRQIDTQDAASQSRPVPASSSSLNSEEETLLQQLLARRSGQAHPQSDQAKTVSYSPFGGQLYQSVRTALADHQTTTSQAQQTNVARDTDRGQRYKITMSNNSVHERSAEPFDSKVSSSWSILNKKEKQVEEDNTVEQPRNFLKTPQDIDAKFQEYRSRRSSNKVDLNNIAYGSREPQITRHRDLRIETRTCVRCGEKGHIGVNCPKHPKTVQPGQSYRQWKPSLPAVQAKDETEIGPMDAQAVGGGQNQRGSRVRRATAAEAEKQEGDKEDGEESYLPARRGAKSRKFVEEPVEDASKARGARRGRRNEDDEIERPARARRGRFQEDGENEARPSRGRRNRDEEEDDDAELSYADFEGARERRVDRKKARQAKKDKATKEAAKQAARQVRKDEEQKQIHLPAFISVSTLAQTLGVRYENFVRKMEDLGFTSYSHDHILSAENASLIAMEYDFDPIVGEGNEAEEDERDLKAAPEVTDKEFLPTRPPVVAIMGHVDHGKTTILDFLRKSSVAASEHGGITQHIGAFSVGLSTGKTITFLDTPGHAAFLEMRKRGATVTDIIILVVAADDSVKPQTIEAIKHAKAANVPIIVAINKVDKEEANIDRVKQDLARHGVEIEDYGGDTQVVPVSGKTGTGIPDLEDSIVTLSEILDHRAETTGPVEGWVLEATTKKAGRVATVLVRRGTLVPGNIIVAGKTWARVRSLRNEAGVAIRSAGPGTPVEVDGWKDQPAAGDEVLQAPNEQKATDVVDYRLELDERTKMAEDMEAINDSRRQETEKREKERAAVEAAKAAEKLGEGEGQEGAALASASSIKDIKSEELNATPGHQTVPFIIKADVSGSVEAVSAYLLQMSNPLVSPTLLRAGVGPVSEFDLEHAAAAAGHIISFNLPHAPEMIGQADKRGVRLIEENVIYRIVGDVKSVLEEKLPPLRTQRVVGEADVAMTFEIGVGGRKKLKIAGCKIRNGMIGRGSRARVLRGDKKIYDGEFRVDWLLAVCVCFSETDLVVTGVLSSLKNVKKDVQEMRKGTECGMGFDDWEDFEVGDQVQTYEEKVEKRTLQI